MRAARAPLLALLFALPLTGCVELSPATLPDRLLEGPGGNGWERDDAASQKEPQGDAFSKQQVLVYQDRARDGEGYPGSVTLATLRTTLRPSEARLAEIVQERVRSDAESKGLRITSGPATGTRAVGSGATSSWFTYEATVDAAGFFTANKATVRIFGEVFPCPGQKTVVVTVGLAQVSDVRSVGGVPLPSDPDPTTWREIVADPRGVIEGARGNDGLAYNVKC